MYASALNSTLAAGENPFDGFNSSRRLWNHTFTSGVHGDIYINEEGDREADYSLNDFDPEVGDMQPIAYFIGQQDVLNMDSEPRWPSESGSPPDTPPCGFEGLACKSHWLLKRITVIAVVIVGLIGFTFPLIFVIHRRLQLQAELHNFWWKINWDEIRFLDQRSLSATSTGSSQMAAGTAATTSTPACPSSVVVEIADKGHRPPCSSAPSVRVSSLQSTFKVSFQSDGSVATGTRLASYKNMKVAVKTLKLQKLAINNQGLVELKQVSKSGGWEGAGLQPKRWLA